MGLQLWTVCALIGAVYAQSGSLMTELVNISRPISEAEALQATQAGYESIVATTARRSHFFCVDRDTFNLTNEVLIQLSTFEQNSGYVLSIWIQYPLLAYLDVHRKGLLMQAISDVLNSDPDTTVDLNNWCLGTYDIYGLTTFNEGVMIHIYDGMTPFNGSIMATTFKRRFDILFRNSSNQLVTNYPGQSDVRAINLGLLNFDAGNALHPGSNSSDSVDPTLYPVLIGVFATNVSITEAMSMNQVDGTARYPFATNPNPRNYYLEIGDYFFSVIGAILVATVLFLIIFGYCIHPFI